VSAGAPGDVPRAPARRLPGGECGETQLPELSRRGAARTIQPFRTFSEIYVAALKALRGEITAARQPAGQENAADPST
jgi:hypothetical protein